MCSAQEAAKVVNTGPVQTKCEDEERGQNRKGDNDTVFQKTIPNVKVCATFCQKSIENLMYQMSHWL